VPITRRNFIQTWRESRAERRDKLAGIGIFTVDATRNDSGSHSYCWNGGKRPDGCGQEKLKVGPVYPGFAVDF
jgi:hypothetical protein